MALVSPSRFNSYMNRRGGVLLWSAARFLPIPPHPRESECEAQPAPVQVEVAVVQAGDDAAAAEVDAPGVRPAELEHVRVFPERGEAAAAHRGRTGLGLPRVQGGDLAVVDDEV